MSNEDGDFKKGRFKPAFALGGLGVVGLAAGFAYMATRTSETTLRPEDVQDKVRAVLVKPEKDQKTAWRKILDDTGADEGLRQEAIFQLARLRDGESAPRFVKLLSGATSHATTRVLSMALLEFPRKDVEGAKKDLQAKLADSTNEDQPQIAAALVYIRDKESYKKLVEIYKKDVMKSAKQVDGSASFDPSDLALLTDRDTFRKLAGDSQAGVRQLVAVVLSADARKDDLDTLKALLDDKDLDVSSAAAVGIAKLNDPSASKLLVQKLAEAEKTDNETARKRYIEALKNGIGGAGLVYALKVVPMTDDLESRGRFIMEELRDMADPAAADAYKEYLKDEKNPPHYRAQIALALADIGDPDAVPYLAERMDAKGIGFHCGSDVNDKCLSNNLGWKRQTPVDADPVTFREQQFSAQDIGDLAQLYPEKKAQFLQISASHLKRFNGWFPSPWLGVSRALVYLGDPETLEWTKKTVHDYKLPDSKLVNLGDDPECTGDKRGCQIFRLNDLATAARFVGLSGDSSQIDALTKLLERPADPKGKPWLISPEAMQQVPNPGFREALTQSSMAAVEGLAEWGPGASSAFDKLLKLAKDKDHGEFPRLRSGRAMGLVGSEKNLLDAMKQAKSSTDGVFKIVVLQAAQVHATPELAASALEWIGAPAGDDTLRVYMWAARVVGWGGTKGLEDKLLKLLETKETRVYAALAIALGGDADLVRRGMVTFEQKVRGEPDGADHWKTELNMLRSIYLDTFDGQPISADDVDQGRLYRFVQNALTMRRAGASADTGAEGQGSAHEWAAVYLKAGLKRMNMNATATGAIGRLILRTKLLKQAKLADDRIKQMAIDTLKFMREQGVIMSLREESGSTGEMARRAFFELRHPEAAMGPADKDKDKEPKEDAHFAAPKK